jgi:hypothetical protein
MLLILALTEEVDAYGCVLWEAKSDIWADFTPCLDYFCLCQLLAGRRRRLPLVHQVQRRPCFPLDLAFYTLLPGYRVLTSCGFCVDP